MTAANCRRILLNSLSRPFSYLFEMGVFIYLARCRPAQAQHPWKRIPSQSPFLRVITNIILEPILFMLDKN